MYGARISKSDASKLSDVIVIPSRESELLSKSFPSPSPPPPSSTEVIDLPGLQSGGKLPDL